MKWTIILSLLINWVLLVDSSPYMPVNPIPYKAYDAEHGYSKSQIRSTDVAVVSSLEDQASTMGLGNFSLALNLPPNSIMFQISATAPVEEGTPVTGSIKATCVNCFTTGNALVTTTGIDTNDTILGDVSHFQSNPVEIIVDALTLDLRLDFQGVTGHFEIDVQFAVAGTYTVPIFGSPQTPDGKQLNDEDSIGLTFSIDLVFTVSGQVDFITGFEVEFPDDAYIVVGAFSGELVENNLKDIRVTAIPAQFKSGAACVTVALRYKLEAGISVEVFKLGFKFEAGAYIDAPQYKACIRYQPNEPCELILDENVDIDVAAYAQAVKEIDSLILAAGPTAATTLYSNQLPSTCLASSTSISLPVQSTGNSITPTPEPIMTSTTNSESSSSTLFMY